MVKAAGINFLENNIRLKSDLSRNCRFYESSCLEPGLHPSETPSDPINRIPLKTGSRRRADLVGPATARPHFGNLKIVGQMQQIGSMARLELTNLVVDPQ
jgi:hypothetical protein